MEPSDGCGVLEAGVKDIRQLTIDLANYLCEDPKKFVLEDHLKVFQQFSEALLKAKEENEQFKKLEERKRKQEEKAAEEKARREKMGITEEPKKVRGKVPPPKEEKSVIDDLLDEVRNGFPLKKLNMRRESMAELSADHPQKTISTRRKSSVHQIQKSRALALLIMHGSETPGSKLHDPKIS